VTERSRGGALLVPAALLLLFAAVIRLLPARARPASISDACQQRSPAIPQMEQCLAVRAVDVGLMLDLAAAYERNGQRREAAALYARALTIDPGDAEIRTSREALDAPPR
jgi:hypothetical protein